MKTTRAARIDDRTLTDGDVAAIVAALAPALVRLLVEHRPEPPSRRSLSRADHARLSRLLPAIAGVFGSDEFAVNELPEHAAISLVLDGLTTVRVGCLLRRAAGVPVDGYVIVPGSFELHRRLWAVRAVA